MTEHKNITKLKNHLLRLEEEADRHATLGDWPTVARLNVQIDEAAAKLRARAVNPDDVRRKAGRFVPKSRASGYSKTELLESLDRKHSKKVSSKTAARWSDDEWGDSLIDSGYHKTNGGKWGTYSKCAHSHPLLRIGPDQLEIQGGSCYSPQGQYDVEIMLCGGAQLPKQVLPWGPTYVRFPIVDQSVPDDKELFDRLVDWTVEQMRAGRKVHVGCIGGHGRTGLLLAVLVNRITGQVDATAWLRQHYCQKAVESQAQIDWLFEHYGIEKVKAAKGAWKKSTQAATPKDKAEVAAVSFGTKTYDIAVPIQGRSVWGKTVLA